MKDSKGNNVLQTHNSSGLLTSHRVVGTGRYNAHKVHYRNLRPISGHRGTSNGPGRVVEMEWAIISSGPPGAVSSKGRNVRSSHAGRRVTAVLNQRKKVSG